MPMKVQATANRAAESSTTSDNVPETLKDFRGVRSRVLWRGLQALPWVILCLLIVLGIIILGLHDAMFTSGVVAAALCLLAFQILMLRIPEALGAIWSRGLITTESNPETVPDRLAKRYREFIISTENALNSFGQWVSAALFALIVGTWTYLSRQDAEAMRRIVDRLLYHRGLVPEMASLATELLTWFVIAMQTLTGFIIGLMVWRMAMIGSQIWRLGKEFDLRVQLGHPDQCGGFEPLGYLCLWNALILTIPAVFLGTWLILGPGTRYARWISLFPKLLLVLVPIAVASFLLPTWRIHREMVGNRARIRKQLDQLTQSIDVLTRDILKNADKLDPEKREEMAKKLELMQHIYEQNKHYPAWPFSTDILIRFLSSQIVPILGLTGLGKEIAGAIGAFLGFLAES